MRSHLLLFSALSLLAASSSCAFADTITYATINSGNATGTTGMLGGTSFTYTGASAFINPTGSAINYFAPSSTFISSTVSNGTANAAAIATSDSGQVHTLTFASPVANLIFDVASLGNPSTMTTYTFNQTFTVLSCGAEQFAGGTCFASGGVGTSGTVLKGQESSGTLEFNGPISSLSFTTANGENFTAFDLGVAATPAAVAATPEPGSLFLLGTGLLSVAGAARRRSLR